MAPFPLKMRVTLVEPLGSSIDLYLQSAGHEQIVARVDASIGATGMTTGSSEPVPNQPPPDLMPQVGSVVEVHVDLRRTHLFEPGDTGMNLSLETTRSGQPTTELAHAMA